MLRVALSIYLNVIDSIPLTWFDRTSLPSVEPCGSQWQPKAMSMWCLALVMVVWTVCVDLVLTASGPLMIMLVLVCRVW